MGRPSLNSTCFAAIRLYSQYDNRQCIYFRIRLFYTHYFMHSSDATATPALQVLYLEPVETSVIPTY